MAKSNRPNSRQALVVILVAVVTLAAIATGLFWIGSQKSDQTAESVEELGQAIAALNQYPKAYLSAQLPQYPGADVTHFDSPDTTPTEGVFLSIVTKDPMTQVADFYHQQLQTSGWQEVTVLKTVNEVLISRTYEKADQFFKVAVTKDTTSGGSIVTIDWSLVD